MNIILQIHLVVFVVKEEGGERGGGMQKFDI